MLAAALVPPTRSSTIVLRRDPVTNAVWRKTSQDGSYMFLWSFLGVRNDPLPVEDSYPVRYALQRNMEVRSTRVRPNAILWALEFFVIALLGAYDYLFLCRRRRKVPDFPPARE